jgi:hypothetical protein
MSLAARQLDVLANPFSQSTNNPKIPDGKISQSMGIRLTAVHEMPMQRTTGYIAIFPGLTNSVTYWEPGKPDDATSKPTAVNIAPSNEHVRFIQVAELDEMQRAADGVNPVLKQNASNVILTKQDQSLAVSQWRVVSSGLKLTLVNSSDDDDGWFEAIRLKPSVDTSNFTLVSNGSSSPLIAPETLTHPSHADQGLGPFGFGGTYSPSNTPVNPRNFSNRNNYMTGKLCDIDKYLFYLQHSDDAFEFQKLSSKYSEAEYAEQIRDFVDPNMDCILIRIHGSNHETCPTKLMAHVQHNIELVYEDTGILARLMTKAENAVRSLAKVRTNISKHGSPAMLNKISVGMPTSLRAVTRKRKRAPVKYKTRSKK